jgi:hypothetical protein
MLKGFKDFLLRGNIVDLATAVVVGTRRSATCFATRRVRRPRLATEERRPGTRAHTPLFASPKPVGGGVLAADHRLT